MAKDFNVILGEAQQIKNEIIEGANTANRLGTCLEDIVQRAEVDKAAAVKTTTEIVAGDGLTGGGTIAQSRTISVVSANDGITVNADNIQLNTIDNVTSTSTTKPLSANQGKVLNDKVAQVETDVNYLDKFLILQRGQILSNSIKQYVPFPVKQNDVVHMVTSNVDLVITNPLTQYYSVSLTKDESTTNLHIIVDGVTVEKDVYIVANSDYSFVFLYVNPPTGVVSYDVKLNVIPFEKLKDWILSEAYTVSAMTYDTYGNVKTANLVFPDGMTGTIIDTASDTNGRLTIISFGYGVPTIIQLRMIITYSGDLVNNITINKV